MDGKNQNCPVSVPFLSNFALTTAGCNARIICELRYMISVIREILDELSNRIQ